MELPRAVPPNLLPNVGHSAVLLLSLSLFLLPHSPGLPDTLRSNSPNSPIQWERIIGLHRFRGGGFTGLSDSGALHPIIIFFLIDLQVAARSLFRLVYPSVSRQNFVFKSAVYEKVHRVALARAPLFSFSQ